MRCQGAHTRESDKPLQLFPISMSSDVPRDGYSYSFSPQETGQPALAVVEAVAELTDRDCRDLKPLYSAIDTTRLIGLFEESDGTSDRIEDSDADGVSIAFQYEGYDVTVEGCTVHAEPI